MGEKISLSKMTFEESILASTKLAKKIVEIGHKPNRIIGIATGGILPAQIISNFFECPLSLIRVARPMTSVKKYLLLDNLPKPIKHFLRKMEMTFGFYRFMSKRIITEVLGELPLESYVIVDDSLDTGKTIGVVLDFLENRKQITRDNVLIAVLTQIFDDANPPADCLIYKNVNFSFPWSRDSKEYGKFETFCRNIPLLTDH